MSSQRQEAASAAGACRLPRAWTAVWGLLAQALGSHLPHVFLPAGTVGILAVAGERGEAAVRRVAERYRQETGHAPHVFQGSSDGAAAIGHLRLTWRG